VGYLCDNIYHRLYDVCFSFIHNLKCNIIEQMYLYEFPVVILTPHTQHEETGQYVQHCVVRCVSWYEIWQIYSDKVVVASHICFCNNRCQFKNRFQSPCVLYWNRFRLRYIRSTTLCSVLHVCSMLHKQYLHESLP